MDKPTIDHQVWEVDHTAQCMAEVIRSVAPLVPGVLTTGVYRTDLDAVTRTWHACHVRMAVTLLAGAMARLAWGSEELDRMAQRCLDTRDHWVVSE